MKSENAISASLVILATIAVGAVMVLLKPILIPILIALMVSFIVSPVVEFFTKLWVPRIVTLLGIFTAIGLGMSRFIESIISNLLSLADQLPYYLDELNIFMSTLSAKYTWFQPVLERAIEFIQGLPVGKISNVLVSTSVNTFSNLLLIAFFIMYFCFTTPLIKGKVKRAFPSQKSAKVQNVLSHINRDIRTYINVHTAISLATGLSVGIACYLMGVPFFYLWGFIAFVLNYIPTIGSIIATVPPVIMSLIQLGAGPALLVAVVVAGVQTFWGNVVEPKIAGDSLGLSPLVILLSLVFWSWMWGVVGAILAVPIASIAKITFMNIPSLKAVSVFMDDK